MRTVEELIFEGLDIMYLLAVFVMLAVLTAMLVDFVSGWRKATERGEEHTSYAASRSLTKILIYEGIVMIGVCMDTMIHFAWAMFMDSAYYVPLVSVLFGTVLCIVEAWSVKEKADHKQRKRMDDAAAALASVLDRETIRTLLQNRLRESGGDVPPRTELNQDNF